MRSRLTYSNVVSTLCLFILLGGGAYAATKLPKNSVGTKQLKKNAVNGSKVADGSLSASDIGGAVNSAKEADHAVNADRAVVASSADQLSGGAAAGFLASDRVKRIDTTVVQEDTGFKQATALSMGPLTLNVRCTKGPATTTVDVRVSTSAGPPASVDWSYAQSNGDADADLAAISSTPSSTFNFSDSAAGVAAGGNLVYRDAQTTISIVFDVYAIDTYSECVMHGTAVQAT